MYSCKRGGTRARRGARADRSESYESNEDCRIFRKGICRNGTPTNPCNRAPRASHRERSVTSLWIRLPLRFSYENGLTFPLMNCITQIGILLRAKSALAADFVSATKFISPTRSGRAVMRFAAKNSLRHARRAMRSGRPDSAKSAQIYIQQDKIIAAVPQARAAFKTQAAARAPRARFGSSPAIKNRSSGVKFRRFSCAHGQIRRGAPAEIFYRFSQRRVRPRSLRSVC